MGNKPAIHAEVRVLKQTARDLHGQLTATMRHSVRLWVGFPAMLMDHIHGAGDDWLSTVLDHLAEIGLADTGRNDAAYYSEGLSGTFKVRNVERRRDL